MVSAFASCLRSIFLPEVMYIFSKAFFICFFLFIFMSMMNSNWFFCMVWGRPQGSFSPYGYQIVPISFTKNYHFFHYRISVAIFCVGFIFSPYSTNLIVFMCWFKCDSFFHSIGPISHSLNYSSFIIHLAIWWYCFSKFVLFQHLSF